MYSLTMLYGYPTDPDEFDRYYQEVHIPIVKKMRGLRGWSVGKCESVKHGVEAPYYMIAGFHADSSEQMLTALASPEGLATLADVPNFATGGVTMMFSDEEVLIPCR